MRNAVIFDVDGTIVDVSPIRHYIVPPKPIPKGWYKDFDAFHRESVNCPVNREVIDHGIRSHLLGNVNIVVTARRAKYRHQTAWSLALAGFPSDALYMRRDDDGRPDYEVKRDILESIKTKYNVIHAVDDNPAVIALWEENGIPTTIIEGFGF